MQLELCLAARTMAGEEAPIAPLPVPGSCSVRVWAEPGIEMTFRITLGDGAAATSRRFDFSFLAVEGEARSFFEVQNFCLFEQERGSRVEWSPENIGDGDTREA
ncbi:unnamed protein product [Effrenium voratum]|nr:unnamed protein product [Effrenium voratum]